MVAIQVIIVAMAACLFLAVSVEQAVSAVLGGGVCVVPTAALAWAAGRERSPLRFLGWGVLRSVATVLLIAGALVLLRPAPLGFFVTLAAASLAYVVAPLASGRLAPGRDSGVKPGAEKAVEARAERQSGTERSEMTRDR